MNRTELSRLVVFATVAETGSFRAAADRLGIAPSAVSHAVSALEAGLGVRLLARTTRATRPTDTGAALLARVGGPLSDIALALREAGERDETPSGPLRLTMPQLAANEIVMHRLPEFAAAYPRIAIDIQTSDRFEDLVAGGFDAGIRLGESLEADMIAVRVSGPCRALIVAAPAYLARHPPPCHPRDLARHNCIRRRFDSGRIHRWELEKDGQALKLDVDGNLILPQQEMIATAARAGLGLAMVFAPTAEADLAAGRLVAVLEDWCPPFDGFYIYHPSRRQMRPALRAFLDFFRYRER